MSVPVARYPASHLDPEAVFLVVEGENDGRIVSRLLEAAGFPLDRVHLSVASGRYAVARELTELSELAPGRCAVVMDLDERSVADARARAREELDNPRAEVFCAVPAVEAWLFADDQSVLANAIPQEDVRRIVRRLPLPEEIPDPKQLALRVFGPAPKWDFLRRIDIGRAMGRSPSLRVFLEGMGRLLGVPLEPLQQEFSRTLSRDVIASLLREISPADAVVFRTLDGRVFTADDLRRRIEEGDELGREFASDLFRISRDLLRRQAIHPKYK
ncbi:MAG TPA: hypothetical protein VLE27_07140 [Thermoanaerobaculia bacterium]|nr:hypothetical protein [Thermoanaerobaculia bacterium]